MLKVNEHPWKFPDGRMACGLTPLGKRKFSSFWLTDTRCWFALWRFFRLNFLTELLYLWLDWMKWTLVACFHCREWMKLAPRTCSWIDARWAFHNNFRCLCHFVASYCFNLSYLHIVWRQNCNGCRSKRMVSVVRQDTGSLGHISHHVFQGVMAQDLLLKPDLVFFWVEPQGDILRKLE